MYTLFKLREDTVVSFEQHSQRWTVNVTKIFKQSIFNKDTWYNVENTDTSV